MLHPENQYVKDNYPNTWDWMRKERYLIVDKVRSHVTKDIMPNRNSVPYYLLTEEEKCFYARSTPESLMEYREFVAKSNYNRTPFSCGIDKPTLHITEAFLSRSKTFKFSIWKEYWAESSMVTVEDSITGLTFCLAVYLEGGTIASKITPKIEGLNETESLLVCKLIVEAFFKRYYKVQNYLQQRKLREQQRLERNKRAQLMKMYGGS